MRAESDALISWQFGTSPALPGKATDVSEPVRHAIREATCILKHVKTQRTHTHTHKTRRSS